MHDLTQVIIGFLKQIGIKVYEGAVNGAEFLPGVRVVNGALCIDRKALLWPGDLLHEAGHIAVMPSALRSTLNDDLEGHASVAHAGEIEAIAWAYAAMMHLQLDPAVCFHAGGYNNQSQALISTYSLGVYPGCHGLVQAGMAIAPAQALELGSAAYPHMLKWLRD